jgi:hypothetical protein
LPGICPGQRTDPDGGGDDVGDDVVGRVVVGRVVVGDDVVGRVVVGRVVVGDDVVGRVVGRVVVGAEVVGRWVGRYVGQCGGLAMLTGTYGSVATCLWLCPLAKFACALYAAPDNARAMAVTIAVLLRFLTGRRSPR